MPRLTATATVLSTFVLATLAAVATCATAQASQPPADVLARLPDPTAAVALKDPEIPAALRPADGARMLLRVHAVGVQIYECAAGKDSAWEWQFRGPEATLTDLRGAKVGDHGAGPFWRLEDGSRIVGQVQASAPSPMAGAIPWLLLTMKSRSGAGALDAVEAVQRINTVGGVAPPPQECVSVSPGRTVRVPYTADYLFWGGAPSR